MVSGVGFQRGDSKDGGMVLCEARIQKEGHAEIVGRADRGICEGGEREEIELGGVMRAADINFKFQTSNFRETPIQMSKDEKLEPFPEPWVVGRRVSPHPGPLPEERENRRKPLLQSGAHGRNARVEIEGAANEWSADVLVRSRPRAEGKRLSFEDDRAWLRCCGRGRPHSVHWSHAGRFSSFESPYHRGTGQRSSPTMILNVISWNEI